MMGKVKTRVFPEPVKAMPIMSRPERLRRKNDVNSAVAIHTAKYVTSLLFTEFSLANSFEVNQVL